MLLLQVIFGVCRAVEQVETVATVIARGVKVFSGGRKKVEAAGMYFGTFILLRKLLGIGG